jgi:predicted dehydrogenase
MRCIRLCALTLLIAGAGCSTSPTDQKAETVRLITLDPGHFHAALVQKQANDAVSPVVHVYAPDGPDVVDHMNRIEGFNTRADNPTAWRQRVITGDDFLERLTTERPGDVVVISGRNARKTEYISASAEAGLHVLSDKPMCVDSAGYQQLKRAMERAHGEGVLIYDIMTERSEICTSLQRELMAMPDLFGALKRGSVDEPAVYMESVHHFSKIVAGRQLKRPSWYFDTTQQGEGVVDVTSHLVDLVLWECFGEQPIDAHRDVRVIDGQRWPTMVTLDQYARVTQLDAFPAALASQLDDNGVLPCYANGEIDFAVRGVHAKVRVEWAYEAPPGAKDTHYAVVHGAKASLVIRQGAEQNYRPELFIEPADGVKKETLDVHVRVALRTLDKRWPDLGLEDTDVGWRVIVPDQYRVGHEAHFAQVLDRFLGYLDAGEVPAWERSNMLAKYYITTTALDLARDKK